jgi:hypothetical protein
MHDNRDIGDNTFRRRVRTSSREVAIAVALTLAAIAFLAVALPS